nr:protein ROOT PRIMORDIUM DEFECTIVE 1 [Ipomoea batatas]
MLIGQSNKTRKLLLKILCFSSQNSIFSHSTACSYIQRQSYVNVYMKWKQDFYLDSIESVHKSIELQPIIALKNYIVSASPEEYSIPISDVSKKGLRFGVRIKVARFFRQYPSVFEEFTGPKHNLPWFRLTQRAIELDKEEREVYRAFKDDLLLRLKKLVLMSCVSFGDKKVLPLKIIQGMQWYLGFPDDFLTDPENNLPKSFEIVEMGDGLKGLALNNEGNEKVLSVMQRNAMKRGVYDGGVNETIAFPTFPSKGLRLRRKIIDWYDEFQKLPYVSPYENCSAIRPDSETAEKRVVGLLHELLSLFVEHAAERRKLLCLRKYLGLPQKVHKAFERHPHIFYLSLKNKTCTAILKEAYCDKGAIEAHPLAKVAIHAIGDRVNDLILDMYASVASENQMKDHIDDLGLNMLNIWPLAWTVARFGEQAVVASVQPDHLLDDAIKKLGLKIAEGGSYLFNSSRSSLTMHN